MSRGGLIQMKGTVVTFTHVVPGTRSRTGGTFGAPTKTVVKGYAMRSAGDVESYKALELIETEAITLDFVPKTSGEIPNKDATFEFGDITYKVRSVENIAPNGVSQGVRIVGAR